MAIGQHRTERGVFWIYELGVKHSQVFSITSGLLDIAGFCRAGTLSGVLELYPLGRPKNYRGVA